MGVLSMRRRGAGEKGSKYLMTAKSNPEVFPICVAQGWCGADGMTYEDAANVTDIGTVFRSNANITHFEEFQYFGVTSIAQYAFSSCTNLEVIKLPNSITTIGTYAFYSSNNLKIITLPDSLEILRNRVLARCGSLLYVDIPASVTSIYAGVFTYNGSNNTNIQYIKVYPITPPSIAASGTDKILDGTNNCPVYVPDESVSAYKTAWSDVAGRIKPLSEFVQ